MTYLPVFVKYANSYENLLSLAQNFTFDNFNGKGLVLH